MHLISSYVHGSITSVIGSDQEYLVEEILEHFDLLDGYSRDEAIDYLLEEGVALPQAILLVAEACHRVWAGTSGVLSKDISAASNWVSDTPKTIIVYSLLRSAVSRGKLTVSQAVEQLKSLRQVDSRARRIRSDLECEFFLTYSDPTDPFRVQLLYSQKLLSEPDAVQLLSSAPYNMSADKIVSFLGGTPTGEQLVWLSEAKCTCPVCKAGGDCFKEEEKPEDTSKDEPPAKVTSSHPIDDTFKGFPVLRKVVTALPSGDAHDIINIMKYYLSGVFTDFQVDLALRDHNVGEEDIVKLKTEFNKHGEKYGRNVIDSPVIEDSFAIVTTPVMSEAYFGDRVQPVKLRIRDFANKLPTYTSLVGSPVLANPGSLAQFNKACQEYLNRQSTQEYFISTISSLGVPADAAKKLSLEIAHQLALVERNWAHEDAQVGPGRKAASDLMGLAEKGAGAIDKAAGDFVSGKPFEALEGLARGVVGLGWDGLKKAVRAPRPKRKVHAGVEPRYLTEDELISGVAALTDGMLSDKYTSSDAFHILSGLGFSGEVCFDYVTKFIPSLIVSDVYSPAIKDPTNAIKRDFEMGVMNFKDAVKALTEYYVDKKGADKALAERYAIGIVHGWTPEGGPPPAMPNKSKPQTVKPNIPVQDPAAAARNPVIPQTLPPDPSAQPVAQAFGSDTTGFDTFQGIDGVGILTLDEMSPIVPQAQSAPSLTRADLAYISMMFRNNVHHLHLHLSGEGFLEEHEHAEEIYSTLLDYTDYWAERCLQHDEDIENFNRIGASNLSVRFPEENQPVYSVESYAKSMLSMANSYVDALNQLRDSLPANEQSDLDGQVSYISSEILYKIGQIVKQMDNNTVNTADSAADVTVLEV